MAESSKRRATMNSRGAYDEDEMLRRAIEESNKETGTLSAAGTLGKRTRDDADEYVHVPEPLSYILILSQLEKGSQETTDRIPLLRVQRQRISNWYGRRHFKNSRKKQTVATWNSSKEQQRA